MFHSKSVRLLSAMLALCVTTVLLAATNAYSQVTSVMTDSSTLAGIWKGWTLQVEPNKQYYSIINLVPGDVGTVVGTTVYPELECGGMLTLTNTDADALYLTERLTYGWARCYNYGIITLTVQPSNTLNLNWHSLRVSTIATSTLELENNSENQIAVDFFGIWQGDRQQQTSTEGTLVLGKLSNVQLGISKGITSTIAGNIAYPSQNCGGDLILQGADESKLVYNETITYGACTDGGSITLQMNEDGTLTYEWKKETLLETGTLRRVSNLKSVFLPIISRN